MAGGSAARARRLAGVGATRLSPRAPTLAHRHTRARIRTMVTVDSPTPPPRIRWRGALAFASAWIAVALISAVRIHLAGGSGEAPLPFPLLVRLQLVNASPWIPATLLALWAAARWPLTRGEILRPLTIHLALGLAVVVTMNLLLAWLRAMAAPPGLFPPDLLVSARTELLDRGHLALAVYLTLTGGAMVWQRSGE